MAWWTAPRVLGPHRFPVTGDQLMAFPPRPVAQEVRPYRSGVGVGEGNPDVGRVYAQHPRLRRPGYGRSPPRSPPSGRSRGWRRCRPRLPPPERSPRGRDGRPRPGRGSGPPIRRARSRWAGLCFRVPAPALMEALPLGWSRGYRRKAPAHPAHPGGQSSFLAVRPPVHLERLAGDEPPPAGDSRKHTAAVTSEVSANRCWAWRRVGLRFGHSPAFRRPLP